MPKKRKKQPAPKSTGPKCPACRRSSDQEDDRGNYFCGNCKTLFDPRGDDEPSHNDPVKAAMVKEERNKQRFPVQRGWR